MIAVSCTQDKQPEKVERKFSLYISFFSFLIKQKDLFQNPHKTLAEFPRLQAHCKPVHQQR